jgi:hypothetical protein
MSTFGAFTVTRASTKLRIGSNGLYGSVANNVPAFEFNTDGTYRGLLVEPGATNLILYSQELDNAAWTKTQLNTTGTPAWVNVAVAPDGTTTAEKLIEDTTSNAHLIATSLATTVIASTYTASVFLKADERSNVRLSRNGGAVGSAFNLSTQAITNASGSVGKIEDYGNGWYRCSITFSVASVSTSLYIELQTSASASQETYLGDGTSGLFAWGAQFELGSVATSPIVTTAGTASRVADVVSLTGASSLIGQASGTIFFDGFIEKRNDSAFALAISNGASLGEAIYIQQASSGNISGLVRSGGNTLTLNFLSANWTAGRAKVAVVYEAGTNKCVICVNGGTPVKGTATAIPACNAVTIGSRSDSPGGLAITNAVGTVALFATPLTDAQIIALTTL